MPSPTDSHLTKHIHINLERLLADPDPTNSQPKRAVWERNQAAHSATLDERIFDDALAVLERGALAVSLEYDIRNTDRTVGARLAGELARLWGDRGLPENTILVRLNGSAGQSFGAFCMRGIRLELWGEANDYVGKSMAGGEIVLRLPEAARYASQDNFIAGNTVLYGATGGRLFAAGRAGERFAVRNSGATAVVEGLGDHGCEYMTGGCVVVLGGVGRNFAAGMTGGTAYVLDHEHRLPTRLNAELVRGERLCGGEPEQHLRALIEQHAAATGSIWAQDILAQWQQHRKEFWRVIPIMNGA
jgi:glutamate synthase (ferredoxin)